MIDALRAVVYSVNSFTMGAVTAGSAGARRLA